MGLGRRKARLDDAAAWVFNRMAHVYDARPAYPAALLDAVAKITPEGGRVLDVGAGIGHLTVPLAERGFALTAVEPAQAMLERLRERVQGLPVSALHARAEALPLADAAFDVALVADALHFLDAELSAREIARVLAPGGALVLVTCGLGDSPFMRSVVEVLEAAAPRRPRATHGTALQLFAVAGVEPSEAQHFADATPVDEATLTRILRSISYIGPAMNEARAAAFEARILALPGPREWARTFTLRWGRTPAGARTR
jgi:ubiquinone/menaquinone biosynthesis C-methylase UbiE